MNKYYKKSYEKNKEKVLARNKVYYEANKNKWKEYNKKWVEENREKVSDLRKRYSKTANGIKARLKASRKYREDNRIKCNEWSKEWKIKNREKDREYKKTYAFKYPEKRKAKNLLNSAIRWGKMKRGKCCEQCGVETVCDGHHEDYSKPYNVIWLCRQCHNTITNRLRK